MWGLQPASLPPRASIPEGGLHGWCLKPIGVRTPFIGVPLVTWLKPLARRSAVPPIRATGVTEGVSLTQVGHEQQKKMLMRTHSQDLPSACGASNLVS
mmetsp:Transcript_38233/g.62249  ORF Transcript_38233/g.62249 Transcript_38233/m.62249 type:complete len:98 (-) Transcript_38233:458-751(-)